MRELTKNEVATVSGKCGLDETNFAPPWPPNWQIPPGYDGTMCDNDP